MLDTIRSYETPEGIALSLRIAGPVVRSCAWAIDMLIRAGLYLAIAIPFSFLGGLGFGLMLVLFFLIEWFYPVLFEMRQGATPGKKAMGLEVIQENGTPLSWSASLIRNLLRAADFLPFLYAAGLVSMLLSRNFQRLGDLAAGTLVVYRGGTVVRPVLPDVLPVHPPGHFSREEQRSLLEFAERAPQLSPARRVELAEILGDLSGKRGEPAVDELLAYASWLTQGQGR